MGSPSDLWKCEDIAMWDNALVSYDHAIRSRSDGKGKAKLSQLDKWVQEELPLAISSRTKPHIDKDEYVKLVEWKLLRGQSRIGLLKYATDADPKAIADASQAAFELLRGVTAAEGRPALQQAAQVLCKIKGMGPATASVVMHAACPHAPFMGDEALMATAGTADRKQLKYRPQDYDRLADALRGKAKQLSKPTGRQWTACEVERSLFAASILPVALTQGTAKSAATASGSGTAVAAAADDAAGGTSTAPSNADDVTLAPPAGAASQLAASTDADPDDGMRSVEGDETHAGETASGGKGKRNAAVSGRGAKAAKQRKR